MVVLASAAAVAAFELVAVSWMPDWELRADDGEATAAIFGVAYFLVLVGAAVAYVFTVVTFLMWLHRASRNAWVLYPAGVRTSPAMAVGCWFIPFVHLVRPYRVVRALHSAAFNDGPPLRGDWAARVPGIFPIWWGTWIVNNVLNNFATRLSFSDDAEKLEMAAWIQACAFPLELIAGICLTAILWSIEARQAELTRPPARTAGHGPFMPANPPG